MSDSFTHIHVHSEFSLLDGAIRIKELPDHLKKHGMSACAISDHGFMGGVIEFFKKMKKAGLKPLTGCEIYVTEDKDGLENPDKIHDNLHMVLIAKDLEGYHGLVRLLSEGATDNFYYKPRIYRPKLKELAGHVVATTACLKGIIAGHLLFNQDTYGKVKSIEPYNEDMIEFLLNFYTQTFEEDFYIEIQDWDDETGVNTKYNKFMIEIAEKRKLPVVITSDCHYLTKEDHHLHEMMMALQLGFTLEEYRAGETMKYGPHFYIKSPEEMLAGAKRWGREDAYHNTQEIADKCDVNIEMGVYHPPVFRIEEAEDYREFQAWKEALKEEK
jgi:DNA polymerase-3 subunit alpha